MIKFDFTPKLKDRYEKCSDETKQLFNTLLEKSFAYSVNHYSTNKPDYRLVAGVVYCVFELLPRKNKVKILLRTEKAKLLSSVFEMRIAEGYYTGPAEWIYFEIGEEKNLGEAIRLIRDCYDHRMK